MPKTLKKKSSMDKDSSSSGKTKTKSSSSSNSVPEPVAIKKGSFIAHCMKCKVGGVGITKPMLYIMKNGRRRIGGTHKKCGTKVTTIIGNSVKVVT